MSRTLKDKPWKIRFRDWHEGYLEGSYGLKVPGFWPKTKRKDDTEWHWCGSTPSAWTRIMMNRPERRAAHLQEIATLKVLDLEEVDFPDSGRKPHVYYW